MAAVINPTSLAEVATLTRPVTLARDQVVAVLAGLRGVMPEGGLPRGSTVVVDGAGAATSLALAVAAGPSAAGGWVAVVGRDDLGLAAAIEMGLVLERLALVAEPPPDQWATVVAALIGAVDVVVVAPPRRVRAADARRLAARARERGTVLIQADPIRADPVRADPVRDVAGRDVAGRGSGSRDVVGRGSGSRASSLEADLRLTVVATHWQGLGVGHGHLQARRLTVEATGRRRAARPRRAELWLPDRHGRLSAVGPVAAGPSAGSRAGAASGRHAGAETDAHAGASVETGAYAGADVDRLVDLHREVS
jgi:hypothetical protein